MGRPQKMGLGGYGGTSGKKLWDDEGKGTNASKSLGTTARPLPNIKYPGDDPARPPGGGFIWVGRGMVGFRGGEWVNPATREKWHPDLEHADPIGPHWDYTAPDKKKYRVFEDGRVELVIRRKEKRHGHK